MLTSLINNSQAEHRLAKLHSWLKLSITIVLCLCSSAIIAATPVHVHVIKAKQGQPAEKISAIGTLVAPQQANISTAIAGRITSIPIKTGQHVKTGQLLLQLQNKQQLAAVEKAQAALSASRLDYQRKKALQQTMVIAKAVIDQAQAQYLQNQADLDTAKAALAESKILAPFAGQISEIKVSVGDTVQANQVLFQLVNLKDLRVDYSLASENLAWLAIGQKVHIKSALLPKKKLQATLTYIAPNVDPSTRTVALQATLKGQHRLLRPGLFVTVHQSKAVATTATIVPENTIRIIDGKTVVYTVVSGRIKVQPVTVGIHHKGWVTVKGIAAGTAVVTSSDANLSPGNQVSILP